VGGRAATGKGAPGDQDNHRRLATDTQHNSSRRPSGPPARCDVDMPFWFAGDRRWHVAVRDRGTTGTSMCRPRSPATVDGPSLFAIGVAGGIDVPPLFGRHERAGELSDGAAMLRQ